MSARNLSRYKHWHMFVLNVIKNNTFQLVGTYYTTLACTEYMIYPIYFPTTSDKG